MRVLHVLNELKPSGAETMLRSAAAHWAEHGVTSEILATGRQEGSYAETLRKAGYAIHHLPLRRSPRFFLDFQGFVRRGRYDIVHQHAEGASYWFGLATLLGGARIVRTLHNNFPFEGNLRWRRAIQRRHLKALGARFVAIAPGVRQNEQQRFGIATDLVWNWIDTDRFRAVDSQERALARAHWGFSEKDVVIVTVGNCSAVKNHGALLEALASLRHAAPLRYLHVGLENEEHDERRLARALGIESGTIFCGWMDPRPALAAADLYVMPSRYEGLGLSAIEALGAGLPALLADVDGLRDLREFFPGLIYARPDAASLAQALQAFCAGPRERWRETASSYPEIVRTRFGVARGVREYVAVYRGAGN